MSPKFKELAEQCWEQRLYKLHFDQEMFAQLIVQECLDIVEGEDDGSPSTRSARLAMLRIKKHFEVE